MRTGGVISGFSDLRSILSHHNQYGVDEDNAAANAGQTKVGPWEKSPLVGHADGMFSSKRAYRKHLAVLDVKGKLKAIRSRIWPWKRFLLAPL